MVLNRGFTKHLPFCIIYGFGAMVGFLILSPLRDRPIALFIVGACLATLFEYIVANLQTFLFKKFWWDYSKKPLNFKGILCLESTIGWGLVATFIVKYLHVTVARVILLTPFSLMKPLAVLLVSFYLFDFAYTSYTKEEKI